MTHIPSERGGARSFRACWSVVDWAHIPQQRGGAPSRVGARLEVVRVVVVVVEGDRMNEHQP